MVAAHLVERCRGPRQQRLAPVAVEHLPRRMALGAPAPARARRRGSGRAGRPPVRAGARRRVVALRGAPQCFARGLARSLRPRATPPRPAPQRRPSASGIRSSFGASSASTRGGRRPARARAAVGASRSASTRRDHSGEVVSRTYSTQPCVGAAQVRHAALDVEQVGHVGGRDAGRRAARRPTRGAGASHELAARRPRAARAGAGRRAGERRRTGVATRPAASRPAPCRSRRGRSRRPGRCARAAAGPRAARAGSRRRRPATAVPPAVRRTIRAARRWSLHMFPCGSAGSSECGTPAAAAELRRCGRRDRPRRRP